MAKYDALRDRLLASREDTVVLTYDDIADLVGGLPMSAYNYPEWWANEDIERTTHSHCKSWQSAGFLVDSDLKAKVAKFTRR